MELTCRSPRCSAPRAADHPRFCVEHRDLFARVRREIEDGAQDRLRKTQVGRQRRRYEQCVHVGCRSPRLPGDTCCSLHARGLEEGPEAEVDE